MSLVAGIAITALAVCITYWPVLSSEALFIDDAQYLTENRLVQNPGWSSVKRFVMEVVEPSTVRGYYQPLSMISLMLDSAGGGRHDRLRPFHRTSLILHVANSGLVAVLIYLLTGRSVAAIAAGLLFGLHPINVESVVWVSQRKTLLATFFALCALIAHVGRARRPGRLLFGASLGAYVLALLSKPTTMPVPFLMLLLDVWPLRRFGKAAVLEKLPFLVLGAVASVVTVVSQGRTAFAVMPEASSVPRVLLVFCHNVVFYLQTIAWPANLSWFYPFPKPLTLSQPSVMAGVVGTCVLVPALLILARRVPVLIVGWLFFLMAMLPAMGFIGFTVVIAANRFAYLPLVGVLLIAGYAVAWAWGRGESTPGRLASRRAAVAGCVATLSLAAATTTRACLVPWRDTLTLCGWMVERIPGVAVLQTNLADALADRGNSREAIRHYHRALELDDGYAEAHCNLSAEYLALGEFQNALEHASAALRIEPAFVKARYNLGTAWLQLGEPAKAAEQLSAAVALNPDFALAHNNLGVAWSRLESPDRALDHFRKAAELDAGYVEARYNLAYTLSALGRAADADNAFREVLRLDPDHELARRALESGAATP